MLESSTTPLYEPVIYSATLWPIILIFAPIVLTLLFVPLFKHKLIFSSLGVIICIVLMVSGIFISNTPQHSFQGKFESSSIAATSAIKKEVKDKYNLEIIDENVFELVSERGYRGSYYQTPALKKLSYTKDYSGTVKAVQLEVTSNRSEVKVIIPEPVNEAPKVKEASKIK